LREIDRICANAKIYPHAFLSGHAHNYQRFTRTINFNGKDHDVPFIICGDSGHNVDAVVRGSKGKPAVEPHPGEKVDYMEVEPAVTSKELLVEKIEDHNYGYLRITVDKELLKIGFYQVGVNSLAQSRYDMVTVDIKTREMVSN